jgi:hypothetical protein
MSKMAPLKDPLSVYIVVPPCREAVGSKVYPRHHDFRLRALLPSVITSMFKSISCAGDG